MADASYHPSELNDGFVVAITIEAKEGQADAVAAILEGLVAPTMGEPGVKLFQPYRSPSDPSRFFVFELYRTEAGWAEHQDTAHFKSAIEELLPRVAKRERVPYVPYVLAVTRYHQWTRFPFTCRASCSPIRPFLLSIMSPGPNVLAIMGTSMSIGRSSGLALALGVASGSFCWALLTASGLSALLASTAAALTVIKIVGGLYLLWLAFKSFRAAASEQDVEARLLSGGRLTRRGYFMRGLTIQMTNPKAALAWIAIISLGLQGGAPPWVALSIVVGATLLSVAIHCVYALAFSTTPMVRLYGKARRVIQGALGAFFALAGLKLLWSRV